MRSLFPVRSLVSCAYRIFTTTRRTGLKDALSINALFANFFDILGAPDYRAPYYKVLGASIEATAVKRSPVVALCIHQMELC